MNTERKKHWEIVYETKNPNQVGWTQKTPKTSLDIINSFGLDKTAKIIDIGGGDSKLVDYLLDQGYENITVLDISAKALEKAKNRLGEKEKNVNWIVSDILNFKSNTTYDVWHDRAAFHFLITPKQISEYSSIVKKATTNHLIIGTFSKNGPKKCSGLDITQYNKESLTAVFHSAFEKIDCINVDHITPFDTKQNFLFCSFKRKIN